MTGPAHQLNRQSGFSLMELLLSLALLAVISVGMLASLGLSIKIYDRSIEAGENAAQISHRLLLREWLSQAMAPSNKTAFPVVFDGSETYLSFVTQAETTFLPGAAAMRIELRGEDARLSFTAEILNMEGKVIDRLDGLLAENASDVRIAYYSAEEGKRGWQEEWTSAQGLPAGVLIIVTPGSQPNWPDFITRPVFATSISE